MKKVMILNGPPNSGKDFGAKLITEYCRQNNISSRHCEFKEKLFELTRAIYNVDRNVFFTLYNNRDLKEKPSELFDGLSPRQALIKVSEEVIKPVYGHEYFGKAAAKNLIDGINVFSDGGFEHEVLPLLKVASNLVIVRIITKGCTFKGDSRNYLYNDGLLSHVQFYDVYNEFDKDASREEQELQAQDYERKLIRILRQDLLS